MPRKDKNQRLGTASVRNWKERLVGEVTTAQLNEIRTSSQMVSQCKFYQQFPQILSKSTLLSISKKKYHAPLSLTLATLSITTAGKSSHTVKSSHTHTQSSHRPTGQRNHSRSPRTTRRRRRFSSTSSSSVSWIRTEARDAICISRKRICSWRSKPVLIRGSNSKPR